MKIRILDPNGVHFGGKIIPKDTELDLDKGPHTDIWLRFKQAEVVKGKPAKAENDGDGAPKGDAGDGGKAKDKDKDKEKNKDK